MRNPARIPDTLLELQEIWEKSPDLRLGQLLVNLCQLETFHSPPADIFFVEDDELRRRIRNWKHNEMV